MRLTEILGRLSGVVDDHDGHLALCPAHRDRTTPSLKLTLKEDGQLLYVCRAGCAQKVVTAKMQELGLAPSDFFNVDGQGARTISAKAPESIGPGEIAGLKMFVDETSAALTDSPEAVAYLADRFGLSVEQADDLDVGYAAPGDRPQAWLTRGFSRYPRLTVPLVGFDGVVRGLQGRDLSGKCPARWVSLANVDGKTWAKYGVLSAGTGYDTILVTEGPGDGLTSVGVGYDALIIRGAGPARNAALVAELVEQLRGRDVVLAFDPDDAGARGIGALATALVADGNHPRQLPFPNAKEDLTDWRERTPATFPAELHTAVRSAPVVELRPAPTPELPKEETDVSDTDAALQTMSVSSREAFDITDVGIAVRLRDYMARTGGGVRYADGIGFLVWDGRVWAPGGGDVRSALLQMGAELISSGDDGARKLALKALSNLSIKNVIEVLPSVPGVRAEAADFDARHDLLSVANGTVDLRTGKIHTHTPADMITKRLAVAYHPDAPAERWNQFLTEVFPGHPDLPGFMKRLVGYGCTGSTSEHCFAFMHGQGSNGKSVFLDALIHVFRGVTQATQFSTFEKSVNVGQASPELASLRGARLVTASETEKYSRLAEALVKQLTGGDPITCRFLNQNPFTYVPSFLLLVAGNFKPAILSQDEGTWRRVKLIPFDATFSYARGNKDTTLPARLREEAEGILAWAVAGAVEWYAQGLGEPSSVATATQDYRESEDRLQEFLNACTVREEGVRVAPMAIRRTYAEWAEDASLDRKERLSGWALAIELESRGFKKDKKRGAWGFNNLRLMTDQEKERASRLAEDVSEPAGPAGPTDIFQQPKEAS
ncbi:phage/plasmid primase, P4 family [Streptomyces sp. ITFR-6]|uniref:phage/plasmid primase, P4 family n=1 Tax=Streptomyces sp. ITFR-6 TaxID=3075197 RepID=UPI00288A3154|nr:phage/plasmid primase, P4 family [Streptomyces sp. ITFR-6]WNI28614.1 phage/plasmid primase, P4 family [Streptomyces sp. ITFR-6]